MLSLLLTLLILAAIFAVAWWIFTSLPLPPPFRWIGIVVFGIIAIVLLIRLLPGGSLSLGL